MRIDTSATAILRGMQRRSGKALTRGPQLTRFGVLTGVAAFLALTMASFFEAPAGDALSYREIATAAPGTPEDPVGSAYTGRAAVHYGIGLVAHLAGVSLAVSYAIASIAVVLALLAVLHALLVRLPLGAYVVSLALFVLNPYALRPYLLQPSLLQDLTFLLGLGVCVFGLLRRRPAYVLAGLAVATLSRQTALLVAPAAALWVFYDKPWRSERRARELAGASLAVTVGLYVAIRAAVASFTEPFEPKIPQDTVLARFDELPGAALELAAHLGRTAVPLIVPVAVLAVLLAAVGIRRVPFATWGSLLLAGVIVVQPAAIDPAFPGFSSNEQRLAALGLIPLVVAIAALLERAPPARASPAIWLLAAGLLAAGSLHHVFSAVGPQTLPQFLVLQLVVAAGLMLALGRSYGFKLRKADSG